MNDHIKITRNENLKTGLTIRKCLVCESVNAIGDCAPVADQKRNQKWFESQHEKCADIFKADKLAKAKEVLESVHVQKVLVAFEYEASGVRYYTAITRETNVPHKYTVRLWEEEGARFGRCTCPAKTTCHHILRVATLDSGLYNVPIYVETVNRYKAHKRAA